VEKLCVFARAFFVLAWLAMAAKKKAKPAKKTAKTTTKKKRPAPKPKRARAAKPARASSLAPVVVTIVQEEMFEAAPMDVYEAFVEPAQHAAFTGSTATGEPVEGGAFTAWDGYIEGRHERLVPGARIVQTWRTTEFPDDHPDSRLDLELRPEPSGGTRLRMTHSGVPRSQAKQYEKGWVEHYWTPLRSYTKSLKRS